MNKGNTIFAQIMSLINEYEFKKCVDRYNVDRHAIKFNCREQFMVMSFAQFTDRVGLRDIETTLNLCGDLCRSGIKAMPRSTLAEANKKKDWLIYQDFAMTLAEDATVLYHDEKLRIGLEEMIYAFDSSTIELCFKLCPWAEFHHGTGAFKMHTLMELRGSIPTFVLLTNGKVSDAKVMEKIPVEAGAFYLMDKGYVAFEKLYKFFQQKGAYFVTRAKDNMAYEVIDSRPVNKDTGVLSDETIRLIGHYSTRKYPDTLRLVVYEDFGTGKVYRFLTKNFAIEDPLTIAELYRERWQIELFFKWIKQHLHIKTFYGTARNAVYTQNWIAVCDYLLLIIEKKQYGLGPSLHSISNSIGQAPLVCWRMVLSNNLYYGKISPDSSDGFDELKHVFQSNHQISDKYIELILISFSKFWSDCLKPLFHNCPSKYIESMVELVNGYDSAAIVENYIRMFSKYFA